jgi:hypothetical protein
MLIGRTKIRAKNKPPKKATGNSGNEWPRVRRKSLFPFKFVLRMKNPAVKAGRVVPVPA